MNTQNVVKKAGLKATLPRMLILDILYKTQDSETHLSAEDIYKELLNNGEDVGLATVYRVLSQFESAGIVTRHNFEEGHSVFEMTTEEHHDHMVCVNPVIEQRLKEIADSHGYQIVDRSIVLYAKEKET